MQFGQYQKYLHDLYQDGQKRSIPNISPCNAAFILNILQQCNVKNMLEIGCANGYSALHWAYYLKNYQMHMQSTAQYILHTIELSYPMFCEAFAHLKACKLHLNVCGHLGNALDILPMFQPELFDAIFIDAQKQYTHNFLQLSLPLLKTQGMIIIDDVIKFKEKMRMQDIIECVNAFNIKYKHDNNNQAYQYKIIQTDTDDGIMLITNYSMLYAL
jgi:predicted O-methyltransferase YrrM